MAVGKYDIELERLRIQAQVKGRYVDLVKLAMQLAAGLGFAWMLFNCFVSLTAANPERLRALATVITTMSLDKIVPWILAGGSSLAWAAERTGKKRLVKKLASKRNQIERNDPYSGSSGLDETGNTPLLEE